MLRQVEYFFAEIAEMLPQASQESRKRKFLEQVINSDFLGMRVKNLVPLYISSDISPVHLSIP